jgi:preprotein translocase subunit SecG
MVFVSSLQDSVFFADGVDGGNVNQPKNTNTTNNNSSNSNNIGSGSSNFGGNSGNKKNNRKIFYVIGLVAFLLIIVLAAVDYHKKHSIPQCDDPDIVSAVKNLLVNNPKFAKTNFGIDIKKPFDISSFVEYAPADKTIRKRFCEALINNKTDIKFVVHAGSNGKDAIITILPNPANAIENLLNQFGQSQDDSNSQQDNSPSYDNQDNNQDTTTMPNSLDNNNSNDDNNN